MNKKEIIVRVHVRRPHQWESLGLLLALEHSRFAFIYLFSLFTSIYKSSQQAFIHDLGITGIGGTVWCVSTDCSLDFNGQNKYYSTHLTVQMHVYRCDTLTKRTK